MIKELYGVFKIDKLSVSNQRGMNIAYVTTTLAATLTNAQEYSKYASQYPLIKWQATDCVLFSHNLVTSSSVFSIVYYYQHASNSADFMFHPELFYYYATTPTASAVTATTYNLQ